MKDRLTAAVGRVSGTVEITRTFPPFLCPVMFSFNTSQLSSPPGSTTTVLRCNGARQHGDPTEPLKTLAKPGGPSSEAQTTDQPLSERALS
jgi:hypothetical protein